MDALEELCTQAIADIEDRLVKQKESDEAEARRLVEEAKKREGMARLSAEKEEKERLEKLKKMAQDRQEIETAERELKAKKEALRIAGKGVDVDNNNNNNNNGDDNDNDNDEQDSESAAEESQVRTF